VDRRQGRRALRHCGHAQRREGHAEDLHRPLPLRAGGGDRLELLLLERAEEELRRTGYLHFAILGSDYLRVAPDWIELSFHGKQERRAASDIASVTLDKGQFTLKTVDASGWFFKKGVFSFEYGKMANVRLFLLALEKLCRIRVA
jgi:hypothetical protein